MEQTPDKKNDNFQKDGKEQFNRSIGLISNFALGFTYLSPLTAVYSLFALAVTLAGLPAVWWILIVACGQLLVALVFGEVASQYPITGGLYPWARRLWGKKICVDRRLDLPVGAGGHHYVNRGIYINVCRVALSLWSDASHDAADVRFTAAFDDGC